MENNIMKEVYKDFFGEGLSKELKSDDFKVDEEVKEEDSVVDIDSLFIDDDSKDLLKRLTHCISLEGKFKGLQSVSSFLLF